LTVLKEIEVTMGRTPSTRYGPRLIDLDILLYDDLVIDTPDLKIPHPEMLRRAFVLLPLADIAPEAVHPITGLSIAEHLRRLGVTPEIEPYPYGLTTKNCQPTTGSWPPATAYPCVFLSTRPPVSKMFAIRELSCSTIIPGINNRVGGASTWQKRE